MTIRVNRVYLTKKLGIPEIAINGTTDQIESAMADNNINMEVTTDMVAGWILAHMESDAQRLKSAVYLNEQLAEAPILYQKSEIPYWIRYSTLFQTIDVNYMIDTMINGIHIAHFEEPARGCGTIVFRAQGCGIPPIVGEPSLEELALLAAQLSSYIFHNSEDEIPIINLVLTREEEEQK